MIKYKDPNEEIDMIIQDKIDSDERMVNEMLDSLDIDREEREWEEGL